MRVSARLLVICATLLATVQVVGAPIARAQCSITGPTQICPGEEILLCGPTLDGAQYFWQDPDGISYMTDCIFGTVPGLYTLTVMDPETRDWSPPCSLMVQSGRFDAPSVSGPASTCTGTPVSWCGPSGNFEYAWKGPNGFAATTACVTLADAGDYFLKVRPLPAGCWGDSSVQTLTVTSCNPTGSTNCPRPAWWWALQCSGWDPGHVRLDRSQLAAVAGCVDDHAAALAWSDDVAGFSRTMRFGWSTLQMRARRQFAAVWANVCGVTPRRGPAVSLDPSTALDGALGGGDVASWLAFADGELTRLAGLSPRNHSVKAAYRQLIRTGWQINHGLGIGTTCVSDLRDDAQMAVSDGMAMTTQDIESLASELMDNGAGQLELGVSQPNPFRTETTLAFAVSAASTADVSIGVFDVSGRLVRELARGPYAPGQYVVHWDGSDEGGGRVRSGLYFIRGRIGDEQVQSRVSFVR